MKTLFTLAVSLAFTALASAKGPFQLSGALESVSFNAEGATFVLSGELLVDDFTPPGASPMIRLRLNHTRFTAREYRVLLGLSQSWKSDRESFSALLLQSKEHGHQLRGSLAGLVAKFSDLGAVETVSLSEVSLIDSTAIETAPAAAR